MTKKQAMDFCKSLPNCYEDYPFDNITAVMRHKGNKKMFALFSDRLGVEYINLKCEPMKADFLRSIYKSVNEGFHMNKIHWNTITIDGDVPDLFEMINDSFELTKPKTRKSLLKNDDFCVK